MARASEPGQHFPVCSWPEQKPAPLLRVFVLALSGAAASRPEARAAARLAARQALAERLGRPLDGVQLHAPPGQPPQVLGRPDIGLSFSHEAGLSLVAVNLDGPVGVDLVHRAAPDDWRAVARDYLGPRVLAGLLAQGAAGFAQAWSAHEAGLKLRGLALAEWSAGAADDRGAGPGWASWVLALPAPWVGSLALPDPAACSAGPR